MDESAYSSQQSAEQFGGREGDRRDALAGGEQRGALRVLEPSPHAVVGLALGVVCVRRGRVERALAACEHRDERADARHASHRVERAQQIRRQRRRCAVAIAQPTISELSISHHGVVCRFGARTIEREIVCRRCARRLC